MSIYMTVFKCLCMHEYMYVCMHVCIVCVFTCMHASMCICMSIYIYLYIYMHVCIHVCIYVIFKLGFERYGGIVLVGRGNCPGGSVRGNCLGREISVLQGGISPFASCLKSVCWSTSRFMELRLGIYIYAATVRRRIHPLRGCDFDRRMPSSSKTDEDSVW